MYINSPETAQIDDDDLFTRPPRSARRAAPLQLTSPPMSACLVCGLRADVLLCRECLSDIPTACARVRSWLDANLERGRTIIAAWDVVRAPQQAAWDRIQDSQALSDYAARCARHKAAGNVYGQLLDAHQTMEDQLAPLAGERERLERALSVLEAM